MIAAAIMLVLGVGDLLMGARTMHARRADEAPRPTADRILIVLAWLLTAAALVWAAGLAWLGAGIAVAVAAIVTMLLRSGGRVLGLLGVAVALVALALAVVLDPAQMPSGAPIARLVEGRVPVAPLTLLLGASAIVFLCATTNALVRVVVAAARGSDAPAPTLAQDGESWRVLRRGHEVAVVEKADAVRPSSGFRGGRFVGPLERVLVLASLLAGIPVVIAGIVAAKGVVRFPEISADRGGGAKAEEFLVGTLCSLLIAGLSVLAILVRSA